MQIVNNIDTNHFNELKELVKDADELHIISPFLMESFDDIFAEVIVPSEIKRIVLFTTLKDNDPELFKKANSLHSFSTWCVSQAIAFRIHIDNKLHGKIYIACRNSNPLRGIITSANFTDRGLNHNHEWGVQIDDPAALKKVINDITRVSSHALTHKELEDIIIKIDSYFRNTGIPKALKIDLEVGSFIKHKSLVKNSDLSYFIKPVGHSKEPFSTSRKLSSDIEKLHFAKRPSSVNIGDIIICYAVGTAKLLGYFEVVSDPYIWDNASRWSWEVQAKNLYPKYSETWTTFENTISSIQATYDSNLPVTYVGGKTLGALQFGADKVRLSEEFGKHVINIIEGSI
ncbi:restriction endonuclease PLD domain-containing protein [Brevibacillus borstelensis]|uniref:restriction endonuclease PLD domain-containing protein n=1 Tax=Brevibacillus borstelensis TaxID=45462 RepID=UPI002E24EC41|nr:NgoFVII family restriction endonuclease [Brevibacillus borstelensis]